MPGGTGEGRRHLAVLDCNIYLDAARLVGPPFSWPRFDAEVARTVREPLPHPTDRAYDSLRAIAGCTSGRFAGHESLEVWTNSHIDKIVRGKAMQPSTPGTNPNQGSGLGWTRDDADALVQELVHGLMARSSGGTMGEHYPHGNPPLDHEDGMVFGACKELVSEDPLASVYCVTRDKGFLDASASGQLGTHVVVLSPAKFVALLRAARARYSIQNMPAPRT